MGDTALHLLLPRIKNETLEVIKYANFLVALAARKAGLVCLSHLPVEMTMDISTNCNLRCPYCDVGNRRIRRARLFINQEDFDLHLSSFGMTTFILWLFSAGEPLLHPQAESILASTRHYESFPVISTNLNVALTSARADALLSSGLGMISVALDGATSETYARYRVGGSFPRVLENLQLLVRRKEALGLELPFIEWRFLLFRHNQHQIEAAKRLAQELGVDILEFSPGFAPETLPNGGDDQAPLHHNLNLHPDTFSLGPACEQGRRRKDTTMRRMLHDNLVSRERFVINAGQGEKGCDWLYLSGMLYPDGALAPCCVLVNEDDDFTSLKGRQTDFVAAWNSDKFTATRAAMSQGQRPETACAQCALPAARDFQFHQRIRAILYNAPDWVLRILARNLDTFFLPFDHDVLFPRELYCILAINPFHHDLEDREVVRELRRIEGRYPEFKTTCDVIAGMLAN